jgi:hypothetical protein
MPDGIPLENGACGMRCRRLTDQDADHLPSSSIKREAMRMSLCSGRRQTMKAASVAGSFSLNESGHRQEIRFRSPRHPAVHSTNASFVKKVNAIGENFRLKEQVVQCCPGGNLSSSRFSSRVCRP